MKLFLALLLFVSTGQAIVEIKPIAEEGQVSFEAIGKPSMLKIKGQGAGVEGQFKIDQGKISGQVIFKLETLKTGIKLRDEHMKEKYLQVKQYPESTLTLEKMILPNHFSITNPMTADSEFVGILDLHGIKKEIKGRFKVENEKLVTTADFEIKLSDFNIDIPTYLGVKVADVVKVHVTFNKMEAIGHGQK